MCLSHPARASARGLGVSVTGRVSCVRYTGIAIGAGPGFLQADLRRTNPHPASCRFPRALLYRGYTLAAP